MKKKTILSALCLVAAFVSGNLAAQTQLELHEQVKGLTEIKTCILSPSFEDAVAFKEVTPNWENGGFQGQDNDSFEEKTGNVYCEKWVGNGGNLADAYLYQTCNVPNGEYLLAVDAKATQSDQSGIEGFYFVACDGQWDELKLTRQLIPGLSNFTIEEDGIQKEVITYYLPVTVANKMFTVGFLTENSTANYVRFDNVRLFTSDPLTVLRYEIDNKLTQLENLTLGFLPGGYEALLEEGGLKQSAQDLINNGTDLEELDVMSDSLSHLLVSAKQAEELLVTLVEGADLITELVGLDYSGKEALTAVSDAAIYLVGEPTTFNKEVEEAIVSLQKAIKAYKLTGAIDTGTATNPFEVTFLIDTPNFSKASTFGEGNITVDADQFKGEWLTTNVYGTAHDKPDNRLNHAGEKNCWNNWAQSFYSLDLHQTLKNLPEGIYMLELLTSSDNLGNARGYATTTNGTAYSEVQSVNTDGKFPADAQWEQLTTTQVYVTEGDSLRIGISSTNSTGTDTQGWFCATDFRLYYYGKGDANKKIFEMKLAEIRSFDAEGTMTINALKDLKEIITKAEVVYDSNKFEGEAYTAVLAEIDSILPLTKARVSTYAKYKKIDSEISDFVNITGSDVSSLIEVVQEEYADKINENADIDADDLAQYATELNAYLAFANAYILYEEYLYKEEFEENTGEYSAGLFGVLEYVAENGFSSLEKAEQDLDDLLTALFEKVCNDGDNVTFLVTNPSFEETTGFSLPGWTSTKYNSAENKNFKLNGVDAYTGLYFVEQWVGGPGKLGDSEMYQTAKVPDGKYTVTVDAMAFQQGDSTVTDIVGYYLVAKNGAWGDGSGLTKDQVLYDYKEITADGDTIIKYSVDVKVYGGQLTFGMILEGTNANWIMCDNFEIILNEKTTGVEDIYNGSSEEAVVYTEGGRIVAPEGATIYSANGLLVRSTELLSGVYFVRVGEKVYKVMVP